MFDFDFSSQHFLHIVFEGLQSAAQRLRFVSLKFGSAPSSKDGQPAEDGMLTSMNSLKLATHRRFLQCCPLRVDPNPFRGIRITRPEPAP